MKEKDVWRFYATGDVGMNREDPDSIFQNVKEYLGGADLLFGQLEPCLASGGSPASQCRLPMKGDPKGGAAIRKAGYDVISFATNHCMDWGREAFFETLDVLRRNDLHPIGAGKNIEEARKPYIAVLGDTRVGFLAYNSILPANCHADTDRPGCAPLRGITHYEQIEPDQPGTPCRIHTFPVEEDMAPLLEDVRKLRDQVDILVLSMHWGIHFIPAVLADYQRMAAHRAIDQGVDLVLGHHPHVLKPVEVYKGKAIFYSMGNFALDPPDLFDPDVRKKSSHKAISDLHPEMKHKGKIMPSDSYKSMIFCAEIREKHLENVGFVPALLNEKCDPRILSPEEPEYLELKEYMLGINENQGIFTEFRQAGDRIVVV
ncbi:MAG: CapA family protein [Blautia sp.]|nr:CapA family protein [Blautia sp.]